MTQIDVSPSIDIQLPRKAAIINTNGYVLGDGQRIPSKRPSVKETVHKHNENILRLSPKQTLASDVTSTASTEDNIAQSSSSSTSSTNTPKTPQAAKLQSPPSSGRRTSHADSRDEGVSVVDAAQSPVRQTTSLKDSKTFQERPSFGNVSAARCLRMVSDKSQRCGCSAQRDDVGTRLRGWHSCHGEADDRVREKVKNWKKSKTYSNVFVRLVTEKRPQDAGFKHHVEPRRYIDDYRQKCTVGNVCNYNMEDPPKIGVDFIDPYAVRIKNICSVADTFDLTALLPRDKDRSCFDLKDIVPHSAKSSSSAKKNTTPDANDKKSDCESAEMVTSRSVPNLTPVRKNKSPKEKSSSDANKQHLPKGLHLDRQPSCSKTLPKLKCKMTVVSPDPISGFKFSGGLTREQTSCMWAVKRLVESSSKNIAFKHPDPYTNSSLLENGFQGLPEDNTKLKTRLSDCNKHAGRDMIAKGAGHRCVNKRMKPDRRPCAKLISLTLGDIGGSSESDAESVKRERSEFIKLKKHSRRNKMSDLPTPVTK